MNKTWDGHESTRDITMHGDDMENVQAFQGEIDAEMERNMDLADNSYPGAHSEDDCGC